MVLDKYKTMLGELKKNPQIILDSKLTKEALDETPITFLKDDQQDILDEANIILSDEDLIYYKFTGVSISWESTLTNVDFVMTGGFRLNGLLDAFVFPSSFWRGAFSLPENSKVPDELKHFEQLGWFERQAWDDGRRGCFIKKPGNFPPPIVLYNLDEYVNINMSYYEYIDTMFDMYAVKGWQLFFVNIDENFSNLELALKDMRIASEQLPLLFPDKDWSYHKNKYQEVLQKLGRTA